MQTGNERTQREEQTAEGHARTRKARLLLGVSVLSLLLIAGGVWTYNKTIVQQPLERVLLSDPRNQVVDVHARFDGWVDFATINFEITGLSPNASKADVFRVLLQYAAAQKDKTFERVILSAFGRKKFIIPGEYFRQLGNEYEFQNPIYIMRTFAPHLEAMDGSKPFQSFEGGWLAVVAEEMNQFNEFHDQWYMDDAIDRLK